VLAAVLFLMNLIGVVVCHPARHLSIKYQFTLS
jgi:hypothetical protein